MRHLNMATNISFTFCLFNTEKQRRGFETFFDNNHFVKPIFLIVSSLTLSPVISIGNCVIVCAILHRPSMRTPANILICSLSIADFLVGFVYLPLLAVWASNLNPLYFCRLFKFKSGAGWIFCSASFFLIVAASCERYLAIFCHLKYPRIVTKRRVSFVIASSWLVNIPLIILPFRYTVLGVILVIGLLIISGTYARIFKLVRRHHHQINAQQIGDTNNARQRKLAVTMAYVIGVSLVSYVPLGIVFGDILIHGGFTIQNTGFFVLCELLFSISSLMNPLIYCMKNQEIRGAVVQLLRDIKNKCTC